MRTATLYRLSGLAVMVGMTIEGLASFLYSRADGVALYLDPLVPINDLAKLFGSLIFLIGLPGAAHDETRFLFQGGLEQNLGGRFLAYFSLSYLVILAGFVSFGFATFRAGVYPRWTGPVIVIGSVAAIVMAPLASVPSGPFRLDRLGVLAASFEFVWCGWHLLRHPLTAARTAISSGGDLADWTTTPDEWALYQRTWVKVDGEHR